MKFKVGDTFKNYSETRKIIEIKDNFIRYEFCLQSRKCATKAWTTMSHFGQMVYNHTKLQPQESPNDARERIHKN